MLNAEREELNRTRLRIEQELPRETKSRTDIAELKRV
jgi:hypothetical protein